MIQQPETITMRQKANALVDELLAALEGLTVTRNTRFFDLRNTVAAALEEAYKLGLEAKDYQPAPPPTEQEAYLEYTTANSESMAEEEERLNAIIHDDNEDYDDGY